MNNQSGNFGYLNDVIILDTGSTTPAISVKPNLVTNSKVINNPITIQTNYGSRNIALEGQVEDHIKAQFDPSHIANIIGFVHMTNKYRITYDYDKEDTFIIKTDNGIIKFIRTPEGLYAYKSSASYLKHMADTKCMSPPIETSVVQLSNMVLTVTENSKGYIQRQFEKFNKSKMTPSYRWMPNG